MADSTITLSLTEGQLNEIQALVAAGESASVSAFVAEAVQNAIDSTKTLEELLEESLMRTGGPVTEKEKEWLDSIFGPTPPAAKTPRKRKAA